MPFRTQCCRCGGAGNRRTFPVSGTACVGCGGLVCTKHARIVDGETWCSACVPADRQRDALRLVR